MTEFELIARFFDRPPTSPSVRLGVGDDAALLSPTPGCLLVATVDMLVAGGPNPAEARAFYDWALTKSAQELANRTRNLLLPANRAAQIRPEAARYANVKVVDVDPARFGAPAERKRLLARWQREIGDAIR